MTAREGTTLKQGNHYLKHIEMFGTYKYLAILNNLLKYRLIIIITIKNGYK